MNKLFKILINIADGFDNASLEKCADYVDGLLIKIAQILDKQPWELTLEEFMASRKFHGTAEPFEDKLGTGRDMIWLADEPTTAQNYIPESGALIYYPKVNDWNRENDIDNFNSTTLEIMDMMGYAVERWDEKGNPISNDDYSYKAQRPQSFKIYKKDDPEKKWADLTYNDLYKYIEEVLGYKDEGDRYRIKSATGKGIQPSLYKAKGRLYMLKGFDKLKIFDYAKGREGDLTDLDYNKYDMFKKLKDEGYDGIRIHDYAQSDRHGNLSHKSIGLFPSGIAKLDYDELQDVLEATNFDWGEGWEGLQERITPEVKQWWMRNVAQAMDEGKIVPQNVRDEYERLSGGLGKIAMNSNSYKLFLDDLREPPDGSWVVVRSFDEAVDYVLNNGFPVMISFDHDLGEGKSGYDFAKWLIEYDMDNNLMSDDFSFNVHSANPVGKTNIEGLLNNYLEFKEKQKN